jgi:ADP-ribose pyrophosphatase YjhB (NUDIX family)
LQAIAQTGAHYAENGYQRERYLRLAEIAAEITNEHLEMESPVLARIFLDQVGYATPRVDVRGAVFQDGRLLLVRERADGGWTLPGGWADVGDVPSEAAEREVWEEAGFRVKARKVIGVYDANRTGPLEIFHAFKIVFLCELIGGEARPSAETSAVAFFTLNEIPTSLSGERTKSRHILDAFSTLANPDRPTAFD